MEHVLYPGNFRTVDLGVYLDQASYPPWGFKATHVSHAEGAAAMASFLNRRELGAGTQASAADFPEGLGLAWTQVTMSDHAGNHIDAPYHFGATVEGKPAKTIDEVPLDWCTGPGVRLDVRSFAGRDIGAEDLRRELDRIGAHIGPGTIPLLWTGASAFIDDPQQYWERQAGLSEEGLHFLLDQGVKLIGIDAYALDVSHATMKRELQRGAPRFFPVHFVGRAREHLHLEKLTNLEQLPRPTGFWFCAFPLKLRKGSAGWVRPVAFVPNSHFEGLPDADHVPAKEENR